ncbi:MAG TPA: type II secretion system major pseudopilin GspG [Tepidisphaeraceae bacterium]|jgi:general secretion pathway protein G
MQYQHVRTNRNRGFTLIELLLVMVILAILAAVVVPKMVGRGEQAKESAAKTGITSIETALNTFEVDNGHFPSSEEGLGALMTQPGNTPNWHGAYLLHPPIDPWGSPYVYTYPGQHNATSYDIYTTSGGKDSSGNLINNWNVAGVQ